MHTLAIIDHQSPTFPTPDNANIVCNSSTDVTKVVIHNKKRRRPSFSVTYPKKKPSRDYSALLNSNFLFFIISLK